MSLPPELISDLDAFREAVRGNGDSPAVGSEHPFSTVTEPAAGAVRLDLTEPVAMAALETALGAARRLPRSGPGRPARWLFPDTLPPDGETGATVLAESEDDGATVARILLRREEAE